VGHARWILGLACVCDPSRPHPRVENVYVVGAVMNVLPDDTMSQQQSATRLLTTMIYGVYRRPHERESDIL
jgi:hypothetical protein